jgi:hypothetical protein
MNSRLLDEIVKALLLIAIRSEQVTDTIRYRSFLSYQDNNTLSNLTKTRVHGNKLP